MKPARITKRSFPGLYIIALIVLSVLCVLLQLPAEAASARFPKPDPANAFPELKIFDASDRPFRIPQEDWQGARQRLLDHSLWITNDEADTQGSGKLPAYPCRYA